MRTMKHDHKWIIAALLSILIVVTITWGLLHLRRVGQALHCNSALQYTWHLAFSDYGKRHPEGKYPPLNRQHGALFPSYDDIASVMGENIRGDLFCNATRRTFKTLSQQEKFLRPTYVYFGYALRNEEEVLAFLEAYPEFIEEGVHFNDDLPAPPGRGSFGGDQFLRLRSTTWKEHREEGASGVPVLIEVPDYAESGPKFRHGAPGGYVLFLSSSARFMEYPGEFLLTPKIVEKIGEITAMQAAE